MLRVIAGSARRLQLVTVDGPETRPTTDRIRETLFNILQTDIGGSRVLDLFAGSGAIAIEALSRGAAQAVIVESGRKQAECIRKNLRTTHFEDKARLMNTDALAAIAKLAREGKPFDIIYMDPPYMSDYYRSVFLALRNTCLVMPDTQIIAEAGLRVDFSWLDRDGYEARRVKEYKTNKHIFAAVKTGRDSSGPAEDDALC